MEQEIKEKLDRSASKLDRPTAEMPGMHWMSAFSINILVSQSKVDFFRREYRDVCTTMDLAHRRLTPDFTILLRFWRSLEKGRLWYMRVSPLVYLCFFSGVFLSSGVTGACPVTTDLVTRVDVRTKTYNPFSPIPKKKYRTHPDSTPRLFWARLGLNGLVRLEPATRYIGILHVV